ncbi:MAG: PRD domain-containing protein [Hespellia sp.]|nr:PRD domain-containing protein [Hespellia sp.]
MGELVTDNRNKMILENLESRKSVSVQVLTEKLKVSAKTISNDMKELNQLMKGSALIEQIAGRYRLFIIDESQYHRIKATIFEQNDYLNSPAKRYGYILNRLMHEDDPVILDELAYEMNIGRTTVAVDLKKLREILGNYDIQIVGKTNAGVTLKGDEMRFRIFVLETMYDGIYDNYPIEQDLIDIVEETCREYHIDNVTKHYFMKSYIVMLDRMLGDHCLEELEEKYHSLEKTIAYHFAEVVGTRVTRLLNIAVPKEEIIFLSIPIAGMRTPMNKDEMQMIEISEEVAELVLKILNRIASTMDFHISPTDLLDEFVYHINFMLNRLKYHFRMKNNSLTEIRKKYPLAYRMAELARDVIEEQTNLIVTEDELGFLASYFSIFLEEQQYRSENTYRVAIVCSAGRITGRMIEIQLKKILPEKTVYEFLASGEMVHGRMEQYDLVISTVPGLVQTKTPIIYLSEIFDEMEVLRKVQQLKLVKHLDFPIKTGLNSLVATMLEPQHFFVLNSGLSYMENVNYMVDTLIEEGALPEDFGIKIEKREQENSMKFNESIGFPHLIYESDKIVIALGVIEREKDEKGIKLILLLALPQEEGCSDEVLMGIYNEMLFIASDEKLVDEISRIKSSREYFEFIIRNDKLFEHL